MPPQRLRLQCTEEAMTRALPTGMSYEFDGIGIWRRPGSRESRGASSRRCSSGAFMGVAVVQGKCSIRRQWASSTGGKRIEEALGCEERPTRADVRHEPADRGEETQSSIF